MERVYRALVPVVENFLGSDDPWSETRLSGYVKGKAPNTKLIEKCRCVIPQTTFVCLLSALCMLTIGPLAETHSRNDNFMGMILGGMKGGQPAEVFATANHVLEKGRDRRSESCIAVGDVANYHDSLTFGVMLRSLLHRGVSQAWARAAVRIMRLPVVFLQIGAFMTGAMTRGRGALTGNRLAALFGRTIMEDVMEYARPELTNRAFAITPDDRLLPQAWSDNMVAYCANMRDAFAVLRILKDALWNVARCLFKDGSLAVVYASVVRYERRDVEIHGMKLG